MPSTKPLEKLCTSKIEELDTFLVEGEHSFKEVVQNDVVFFLEINRLLQKLKAFVLSNQNYFYADVKRQNYTQNHYPDSLVGGTSVVRVS